MGVRFMFVRLTLDVNSVPERSHLTTVESDYGGLHGKITQSSLFQQRDTLSPGFIQVARQTRFQEDGKRIRCFECCRRRLVSRPLPGVYRSEGVIGIIGSWTDRDIRRNWIVSHRSPA